MGEIRTDIRNRWPSLKSSSETEESGLGKSANYKSNFGIILSCKEEGVPGLEVKGALAVGLEHILGELEGWLRLVF